MSGKRRTSRSSSAKSPPPTCLLLNVVRAWSTSSIALATQRMASLDASGSSLYARERARRAERFAAEAMTSDPAGYLPSDLTAWRAGAASGGESRWRGSQRAATRSEEAGGQTFGGEPALLAAVGITFRQIVNDGLDELSTLGVVDLEGCC